MISENNELISCIDNFIKEKQQINSELQKPNTIKKKELEQYLEDFAGSIALEFEKNSEPTKTTYSFSLQGQEVEVQFFYRYSNYYTRHSISIK